MPRTWSYRKTETVLTKPVYQGQPLAAKAYIALAFAILTMVLGSAAYFVSHQYKEAVVTGPKSESYQTIDPSLAGSPKPIVAAPKSTGANSLLDENH